MQDLFDHIDELTEKYIALNLHQVIDHDRFNHYSIVHHSTSIEGSTLSELDTQQLLAEGITAKGKPLAHHLMVKDHYEALQFILRAANEKHPVNIQLIQTIGALVMKSTGSVVKTVLGDFDTSKGEFRKTNVVAGRERFVNYDKVIPLVTQLCQVLNSKINHLKTRKEILTCAFDAHFDLVSVHPFGDGNGRSSRLVMNYIEAYYNEVLTIVFKEDKTDYIQALMDTREHSDLTIFRTFMCNQHIKLLEAELENERRMRNNDGTPKGYSFLF
jgi:Fic family protein